MSECQKHFQWGGGTAFPLTGKASFSSQRTTLYALMSADLVDLCSSGSGVAIHLT